MYPDDDCEELDRGEKLDDEEEQGKGLQSEDRHECVVSSGKIWRSSVTEVISETHEKNYITSLFSQYLSYMHAKQYHKKRLRI